MKQKSIMAQNLTLEDITDNIVIIKINKSYRECMSETVKWGEASPIKVIL